MSDYFTFYFALIETNVLMFFQTGDSFFLSQFWSSFSVILILITLTFLSSLLSLVLSFKLSKFFLLFVIFLVSLLGLLWSGLVVYFVGRSQRLEISYDV